MALSGLSKVKRENGLSKAKATVDSDNEQAEASASASDTDDESNASDEGNVGWANSIAKVLSTTKPKTKKTLVLSRAKKIKPGDKEKPKQVGYGFEVEGEVEVKEEKPDTALLDEAVKARKNIHLDLRVKPSWKDLERERALRKIAQRGVVQLFNAVRIQQKDLEQQLIEAGPLDSRKDAVLNNINKRKFLDVLMGGKRAKSEAVDNPVKREIKKDEPSSSDDEDDDDGASKKKSEWNVFRDDFMTNKKIKHWDEDSDNSEGNNENADNSEASDEE